MLASFYEKLLAIVLVAGGLIAIGWHLGGSEWKSRYNALQAGEAQARADDLAQANAHIQAQELAYRSKLQEILNDRDAQVGIATDRADELARSLHDYARRLDACAVSTDRPSAARVDDSTAQPGDRDSLADLTRRMEDASQRVDRATDEHLKACAADAEQLIALEREREALK